MSATLVMGQVATVITALTPSPATPAYHESDYSRLMADDGVGNLERKFFVGCDGMEYNAQPTSQFGGVIVVSPYNFYVLLGYEKKGLVGGNLDKRITVDIKQILDSLYKPANFHSSVKGHSGSWKGVVKSEVTQRAIIARIDFGYLLTEAVS